MVMVPSALPTAPSCRSPTPGRPHDDTVGGGVDRRAERGGHVDAAVEAAPAVGVGGGELIRAQRQRRLEHRAPGQGLAPGLLGGPCLAELELVGETLRSADGAAAATPGPGRAPTWRRRRIGDVGGGAGAGSLGRRVDL